jgi:adenosylcobinamide-phosphate synthase
LITTLALIIGYTLDTLFGDPYLFFPHPIVLIGRSISFMEKKLRPLFSKDKGGERICGLFLTLSVTLISFLITVGLGLLAKRLGTAAMLAFESFVCFQMLAQKTLKDEAIKVYKTLLTGDIDLARKQIAMLVGRDTEHLSTTDVTKATIETVAENTSDGVIAPLLYFAIGGAPAAVLYKAINTLDSMVGYKNDKYINVGMVSAKLDDIANFIPARLSALMMIVSSMILHYDTKGAVKIFLRDRYKHASPNSAQTESVCAGALGIRLAGDSSYFGVHYSKPYIGEAVHAIEPDDILKTNRLMSTASFVALVLFVLFRFLF